VLEAARSVGSVRAILNVTSDKCYENREWEFAYRENDAMGGYDPYSASKGCSELVTAAYRQSFFGADSATAVATARAGNVIGGGDWALDRIVPDCVRALSHGEAVTVRNPDAVRPWQHVLEPTSGYLLLASKLFIAGHMYDGSWNFGPAPTGNLTVREVVETVLSEWGSGEWVGPAAGARNPHEAHFLKLDCSKAADLLEWRPVWDSLCGLRSTTQWYREYYGGDATAAELTSECIGAFVARALESDAVWTR
jgi:CDP-glucose 4,6-dehydratase